MAEEQVLNTHNAEILLSAANKSHYPQDDLVLLGNQEKPSCSISTILTTSYALWMCQVTVMPVCPKKNVPNGVK